MSSDPHRDTPVLHFGAAPEQAAGAVILLHGRGASAEDILSLAQEIDLPQLAYFAPEAAGSQWYPQSFLAPIQENEPWLSSSLKKVRTVLQMIEDAGIAADRVVIGGFSQGACLSTEFVASHPRRYAGLIALTGGLVGPLGSDLTRTGDLAGTPAFLGSGDPDPHVPWSRVLESAEILTEMGAIVTARRYPGRSHTVSRDELLFAKGMLLDAFFPDGKA